MELLDKVALVTGGAHRVGKAIALALASQGMDIAFTYRSSAGAAERTLQEIEALGVQALALPNDQADPGQVVAAMQAMAERFGRLDVLVNSAAILQEKPLDEITLDDWNATIDINLRGPFLFTQQAARLMLKSGAVPPQRRTDSRNPHGVIINISDESALMPYPGAVHHTVSKAGLVALTKVTALALAPHIHVHAIVPGAVLKPSDWDEERWQALAQDVPLAKLGSPDDVTGALLYLLSAQYATGQVIAVDGGTTIR
jgi:NAD(P)-dependent dehydrogenase (short-subunit alcohol dehydrogenase family)